MRLSEIRAAAANSAVRKLADITTRISDRAGVEILTGVLSSHLGSMLQAMAKKNQQDQAFDVLVGLTNLAYSDTGNVLPRPDSSLWDCFDPPLAPSNPGSVGSQIALIPAQQESAQSASVLTDDMVEAGAALVLVFEEMEPTVTAVIREESLGAAIAALATYLGFILHRMVLDNRSNAVNDLLNLLRAIIEFGGPAGVH